MTRRLLLIVAGAAVVVRVAVASGAAVAHGAQALHARDTSGYLEPAAELLERGTFTRGGRPEIVRTPGYSLLLLPGLAAGQVEAVTVALQALLSAVTVLAVCGIALQLYGRAVAMVAAALYALEPLSVLYAGKLLSETLFTTCLTGSLYLLLRVMAAGRARRPAAARVMAAGGLLAAAALTRPLAWPLALAIGLAAPWLVGPVPPRTGPRAWLPALLLTVTAIVPPLAWEVRNAARTGYGGLSAIVDVNAYFYQGAATSAAVEGESFFQRQDRLGYHDLDVYLGAHPEQRSWTPARRLAWMGRQGRRQVWSHPWTYAAIHLRGMARVAVDPGGIEYLRLYGAYPARGGLLGRVVDAGLWPTLTEVARRRPWLTLAEGILGVALGGLYLLAARGLLAAPTRHRAGLWLCLAVTAYLWVASGGPQSLSRFRHPIMPVLCVLAGAGLVVRLPRTRRRHPHRVLQGAGAS